jgi:hypothetical protein
MVFKRQALLIGYSGWDLDDKEQLEGVSLDLVGYKKYLMSTRGGAWKETEIKTLYDTSKENLQSEIHDIKEQNYDLIFLVYSGHGCYLENEKCRELQISKDEFILEKDFYHINEKQLVAILDTCAKPYDKLKEELIQNKQLILESQGHLIIEKFNLDASRKKYEDECKKCPNSQKLFLYAAQKGKVAKDTMYGGYYSTNLLNKLNSTKLELDFKKAHDEVSILVKNFTHNIQIPDFYEKGYPFGRHSSFSLKYLPAVIL